MELKDKELKDRYKVNSRPIISLLIGLGCVSVIIVATMLAAAKNMNNQSYLGSVNQQESEAGDAKALSPDGMILAVVEEIDTENKQITLFDVNLKEAIVLEFTGGTNITDKYGKIISISQISIGSMVDVSCQTNKNKLISMNISTKAWEYPGVNNMSINLTDKIMKIASTKYKYTDDLFILDGDDFITVDNLAEQDQLTVWGYEETIWSITVTKGHGTVKLKDYEDYLGDSITIGYESMQQITDNLEVTVREGTFNLIVENGLYSATKSITVNRNQVTYASLSDLGPEGLKMGDVIFEITPYGADLYIDKELTTYSDPIELSYGEHSIIASLGGYTSYTGKIEVDSDGKTIKIDLPEATSAKEAVVTETNTSSSTGADTDSTDTDDADDTDDTDKDSTTGDNSDDTQYSSENTEYTLDEGDTLDKDHKIYVKSPSGAAVYLDGEYMGTAPCSFDKIIGSHVMTFIKDGYETMSYTVEVTDDGVDAYFTFPDLTESNK
ncbi:MAG: PEGA domain-containing protein [Herbinix sp.]|nr:PEGA domain-containing protein [Herbinix sp.]